MPASLHSLAVEKRVEENICKEWAYSSDRCYWRTVNNKVDMHFNVKNAYWLSERIREKIMQKEKNRINKDGEIVLSSTKTRTQKGNIEDALAKLQAIIAAASYVPPPPSEEQKKKIAKLAAVGEQKRLQSKKVLSNKKAFRRNRSSWD